LVVKVNVKIPLYDLPEMMRMLVNLSPCTEFLPMTYDAAHKSLTRPIFPYEMICK
jgi:hypothetical protein